MSTPQVITNKRHIGRTHLVTRTRGKTEDICHKSEHDHQRAKIFGAFRSAINYGCAKEGLGQLTYQVVVRVQGTDHIEYRNDSLSKAENYAKRVSGLRWGGRRVVTSEGQDVSHWDNNKRIGQ